MSELTKTEIADLRLHGGTAPSSLVRRMIKLAGTVLDVFIDKFGSEKLLVKISDVQTSTRLLLLP